MTTQTLSDCLAQIQQCTKNEQAFHTVMSDLNKDGYWHHYQNPIDKIGSYIRSKLFKLPCTDTNTDMKMCLDTSTPQAFFKHVGEDIIPYLANQEH